MSKENAEVRDQVRLIEEAMKESGIWHDSVPGWVQEYKYDAVPDFWQWLQFVHLPMRAEGAALSQGYLATQVRLHLRPGIPDDSLLVQRIIELDSLSPTIKKN